MKIIIGNKIYESWDEPTFPSKRSKDKTISLKFYGHHQFKDFPEFIILDKFKYQWILKGCKLTSVSHVLDIFDKTYDTCIIISYESKSGSHIKEAIKSEIRNINIERILG